MDSEASGTAGDRRAVLHVLAERVEARFRLTVEAFADRVLQQARVEGRGAPPAAYAARLSLDDLYLATACAQGDERAWEECSARHFGFIRAFAQRRLRGPQAEDVANQVIADLWQRGKLARFSGRSSLRTWLGAVVAHAAVNSAKATRPLRSLDSDPLPEAAGSETARDGDAAQVEMRTAGLLADLVSEVLGALAAEDRLLLLLYFEDELTLDQIAPIAGRSKAWLSRRLKSVREGLRSDLARLAQQRGAADGDQLRLGLDLGRIPLDLARALSKGRGLEEEGRDVV